MEKFAREKLNELGLMTIQNINQAVETLSGGQRQGVAVARAAAFGSKVVILDEPTAALGVKESRRVLELIRDVRNARHPDHPDQPQHAACVRDRRPHPHPPAGQPACA
jgi:fructose transport system ATP-binding protein